MNKEHVILWGRIQCHSLKTIRVAIQVNALCGSDCPWPIQLAFVLPQGIHISLVWWPLNFITAGFQWVKSLTSLQVVLKRLIHECFEGL